MTRILNSIIIVLTMLAQKIFGAGNSDVVSLPKDLVKELGFKRGDKVIVSRLMEEDAIVIRKHKKTTKKSKEKTAVSAEFKKWLKDVLKEDKEILDELSLR